ncbi:aldo/keto reductase [Candidatus Pacearchaeota archaeon]|nr:aldo/keto reductase [Candidatus Pacearchaeota archaeon]
MDKNIFPIGIGGWGIGGFAKKDSGNDKKDIEALVYSLKKGMNFIEVNYWNSEGHNVELLAEAIEKSGVDREKLFLHQALYCYKNETLEDVRKEMKKVREILDTNYMDSVEFDVTGIEKYGFDNVAQFLKDVLESGETKFVSITNSDLKYLKKFKEIFGDKMFCHELNFNFEIRENEHMGIIEFADENNILNVIYQPIRRNKTIARNWPLLVELSEKYGKTQNQIIFNWLISRGFLPLTKSSNLKHIDENLGALDFKMRSSDIEKLNGFRTGWDCPEIVFNNEDFNNGKVVVHQLSNVFDDVYNKGSCLG